MKKIFIVLLTIIGLHLAADAQSAKKLAQEARVVVDSNGTQYPYAIWKKLVATKEYRLKKIDKNSDSSAYLLVKLDSAQVAHRMADLDKPRESENFTDGEQIDLFSCKDINGNKIKAADLKGKVVVLNFWFIGCPPCRMEIPALNELSKDYAGDPDVVFIAVALDQKWDIQDFIKTNPLGYHIIDDGRTYANRYGIHLYPTNVVVDRQGKVRFSNVGYAVNTPYWIKKTIEEAKNAN